MRTHRLRFTEGGQATLPAMDQFMVANLVSINILAAKKMSDHV